MESAFDIYRKNKEILDYVNQAVALFNNPHGTTEQERLMQKFLAQGVIMMDDKICDVLRDKKSQNKEDD